MIHRSGNAPATLHDGFGTFRSQNHTVFSTNPPILSLRIRIFSSHAEKSGHFCRREPEFPLSASCPRTYALAFCFAPSYLCPRIPFHAPTLMLLHPVSRPHTYAPASHFTPRTCTPVFCFVPRSSFRDAMPITLRLPRRFAPRNDTRSGRFVVNPIVIVSRFVLPCFVPGCQPMA